MNKKVWGFCSVVPLIVGIMVLSGWIMHKPELVQFEFETTPLYFNAALAFVLASLGLVAATSHYSQIKNWQVILGFLVFIIGFFTFLEYLFHIDLGIDQFFLKDWRVTNFDLYPGRMDPNSTFGFMSLGLIIALMPFAKQKWVGMFIDVILFLVSLMVVMVFIGHTFNIEFLYSFYNSIKMNMASIVCFALLCFGLWGIWRNEANARTLYQGSEDYKIILLSSAILLSIAFAITLTIVASLIKREITMQTLQFQKNEQIRALYFSTEVEAVWKKTILVRDNKLLVDAIMLGDAKNANFQAVIQLLQAEGFNEVTISKQNKVIYQSGKLIQDANLLVAKKIANDTLEIFWKKGWYARIYLTLQNSNQSLNLILQAPLITINKAFGNDRVPGETGDHVICAARNADSTNCFYARDQAVRTVPYVINGQHLTSYFAMSNTSGTKIIYDYHLNKVLAAYGPIPDLPLGLVIKENVDELFYPITKSVRTIFPVLLFTILGGLILLRIQVLPLVRRVINAEKELTRSNKRLKNSEERYALAVRGSNAGLWDWNIVTDEVFFSPYFKGMLGYTETEFPNKLDSFYNVLHPDDSKNLQLAVENHLINHANFDIEYRLRRKSGDYHWYKAVGQALWDEEDNPLRMAGSITDITDRKRNEQRLAAQYSVTKLLSEAQTFEEVADKILQDLCQYLEWDLGTVWLVDNNAGIIRNTNLVNVSTRNAENFEAITKIMEFHKGMGTPGRIWETSQPLWVYDLTSEANFPRSPQAVEAGFKSLFGFPILLQNRVLGCLEFYSGEQNPPDESLLKMMNALTTQIGQFIQRKNAEAALRENEGYKTAILESASDSILTIDEEGAILSCNAKTNEIFGFNTNEIINKNIDMLVPNLSSSLKTLAGQAAIEFVGIKKNQENFSVELSISKMFFGKQNVYACNIRDISERKKVDKLKNEFVSVVSHELRTPLTSIRGSLGLILGGTVGDYSMKARMLLEIANNNCERLLLLINDILDIEKIQSGKMQFQLKKIEVSKLLTEAFNNNRLYAERLEVQLKLGETLPGKFIYADPDRLLQVLANLISNAAKFSPPGKDILVTAEDVGQNIKISVIDNGNGIPEKFRDTIFKRFSQADTSSTRGQGGTGLGLSITKAIIENLNGKIAYTSEENKGSTFYFEIPKYTNEIQREESAITSITASGSLLICEDDEAQAKYVKAMLESAGYNVDISHTVKQAKEFLNKNFYDALLLDLILPDQDGIAFIRELRSHAKTNELPIIVLSVITQTGKALMEGDALAVVDWLDKPVDFNKLLHSIEVMKIHSTLNQPHILHIEDDADTRNVVATMFAKRVVLDDAKTLREARLKIDSQRYDLVILDLILPDGNGVDLLPILAKYRTPVIVFSTTELDKEYAHYVKDALVKSNTTNSHLLATIKDIIEKTHIE